MSFFDKVEMQFQSDPRYKGMTMTAPVWQSQSDYFGNYGCLGTAFVNWSNHYSYHILKNAVPFMTLGDYNNKMIENYGYEYLAAIKEFDGDIVKAKLKCYKRESYAIQSVVNQILGIKARISNYKGMIDFKVDNEYYLLHTKFQNTNDGHWSALISHEFDVIDSYDGVIRRYPENRVIEIDKIIF